MKTFEITTLQQVRRRYTVKAKDWEAAEEMFHHGKATPDTDFNRCEEDTAIEDIEDTEEIDG